MLVVQHNCNRGYESTIASLETAISTGAGIVCLQKPFIANRNITHSAFNFYWPGGSRTEACILTAEKKELVNKIIVENRSDLVDNPYFLGLHIRDVDVNLTNRQGGQGWSMSMTIELGRDVRGKEICPKTKEY